MRGNWKTLHRWNTHLHEFVTTFRTKFWRECNQTNILFLWITIFIAAVCSYMCMYVFLHDCEQQKVLNDHLDFVNSQPH